MGIYKKKKIKNARKNSTKYLDFEFKSMYARGIRFRKLVIFESARPTRVNNRLPGKPSHLNISRSVA